MLLTYLSLLSAFTAAVHAQAYGAPPPDSAPAAAPSAPPSTAGQINVDVAPGGNFVFNPANFTAANGTLVTFFFPSGSIAHSVTQSSFDQPCTYLASSGSDHGFDSGLQNAKQFTINITDDTQPIWFHCKFPLHCGMGMVGSINAPSTGNTFDMFMANALKIGPGETTEQDNGPVTGGINAQATAAPASGATTISISLGMIITGFLMVTLK